MFFKIAVNNIRKSYKDYLIYFLTISFGICLFYIFNSMESQNAMLVLTKIQHRTIEMLSKILGIISIFMSVILAFLIVYANQFLIKRRKKELGIYMTLGMSRFKISTILVFETILIGVISLIVGIILGVVLSHFFSIITAKMFYAKLDEFKFIFSIKAFIKSILNFGLIFTIVIIFNLITIKKVKLIDLLYANKKNEKLKIRNPILSVIIFILSLVSIGISYYLIITNGMLVIDNKFTGSIILGSLGTLLFFFSLSEILIRFVKRNKKIYYNGLNIFTLKQISSKINTTFIMMSIISIMLLIAIGTFSTGMGVSYVINNEQDKNLPYDFSMIQYGDSELSLLELYPKFDDLNGSKIEFDVYKSNIYLSNVATKLYKEDKSIRNYDVEVISISDFNANRKLQDLDNVFLNNDEYLLLNVSEFVHNYDVLKKIEINEIKLKYKKLENYKFSIMKHKFGNTSGLLVVPDLLVLNLEVSSKHFVVTSKKWSESDNEKVLLLKDYYNESSNQWYVEMTLRDEDIAESLGVKTIVSYISIYVGLVFIMTSVVVLALQQLTQTSDSIERYILLKKLGVDDNMIKKSLLLQISVYFFLPLGLAICHSVVGIYVASNLVSSLGNLDILKNVLLTAGFVLSIYISYFVITYSTLKSIVFSKK